MKKLIAIAVLLGLAALVSAAPGTVLSIQFTDTIDSKVQGKGTNRGNAVLCAQFGLNYKQGNCTNTTLVQSGCIATSLSIGNNPGYQNCTLFTADAAGEAAYAKDIVSQKWYADAVAQNVDDSISGNCAAFNAATTAQQNAVCAAAAAIPGSGVPSSGCTCK